MLVYLSCMFCICCESILRTGFAGGQSLTPELARSNERCDPLCVPRIADKTTRICPRVRLRHGDTNSSKYGFCFLEGLENMFMFSLFCICKQEMYLEGFRPKAHTCPLLLLTAVFLQSVHSSVSKEDQLIWDHSVVPALGMSQLPDGQLFTTSALYGTILEGEKAIISDYCVVLAWKLQHLSPHSAGMDLVGGKAWKPLRVVSVSRLGFVGRGGLS